MDNYIGEIKIFAGNYAPSGWALCNGALLNISENEVLFSLLGTTYGGDGVTTFALPNTGVRIGLSKGNLAGGQNYLLGEPGGVPEVTLTVSQIPAHTHGITAVQSPATTGNPGLNFLAATNGTGVVVPPYPDVELYTTLPLPSGTAVPNVTLDNNALTMAGSSQAHNNMMPYVCLNFIIALSGIYPTS